MALIKIFHRHNDQLNADQKSLLAEHLNSHRDALPARQLLSHPSDESSRITLFAELGQMLVATLEIKQQDTHAIFQNLVVHRKFRGQGLALQMVLRGLTVARQEGLERAKVACLESHLKLFRQAGFVIQNRPQDAERKQFYITENPCISFYLAARKSRLMHPPATGPNLQDCLIIGKDLDTHNFHDEEQYLDLHRSLLAQAAQRVWLLCDSLQNPVMRDPDTAQSLLRLVKSNPHAEIKLLIADDKSGAGYYNPTIAMAQRLSSYIEIRTLKSTGVPLNEMLTLVDYSACIYRKHLSDCSGFANFNSRLLAERLRYNFDHHWQFAKVSQQLRRLAI